MTIQKLARQGVGAVALGALLALQPATFGVTIGGFGVAKAFAKDGGGGNDSSGSGSSGSGSRRQRQRREWQWQRQWQWRQWWRSEQQR